MESAAFKKLTEQLTEIVQVRAIGKNGISRELDG